MSDWLELPPSAAGWRAVFLVAVDELRRAARSRWILVFAVSFAVLALGISYFGLAGTGPAGFQSFRRVTASLLNLVLLWVPLVALLLAVSRLTGSREALGFFLSQPLSRRDALLGKYLGLAAAFSLAQCIGFGGAAVVIAVSVGGADAGGFVVLVALSLALGGIFLALGLAAATLWPDRVRALGAALAIWLLATLLYDLAAVGVTSVVYGLPVRRMLVTAVWCNPVDLSRVLATAALGGKALFGPTGAAVGQFLVTPLGALAAAASLLFWLLAPLGLAVKRFEGRDF